MSEFCKVLHIGSAFEVKLITAWQEPISAHGYYVLLSPGYLYNAANNT